MDTQQLQLLVTSEFKLESITDTTERSNIANRIINVLSGRIADTLMDKLPDEQINQLEDLINNGLTHEDLLKYFQTMDAFNDIIKGEIEKLKGEILV
jgi:uncharacterized membrane protein YheB (UPF0754 family)